MRGWVMALFIRTVTGDISTEALGFTHCHEHLFTGRMEGVDLEERLYCAAREIVGHWD